jgi:hypothetical protein
MLRRISIPRRLHAQGGGKYFPEMHFTSEISVSVAISEPEMGDT